MKCNPRVEYGRWPGQKKSGNPLYPLVADRVHRRHKGKGRQNAKDDRRQTWFCEIGEQHDQQYLCSEEIRKPASFAAGDQGYRFWCRHKISRTLVFLRLETRRPPVIPRNPELLDFVLQRSPFYAEPGRRAIRTTKHSCCLSKNLDDVLPVRILSRTRRWH